MKQNVKYLIIDGNNLIGKDGSLSKFQRSDKHSARKNTITLLETYLHQNKVKISCHFDGHPDNNLKSHGINITYSYNKEADYFIKKEIDSIINKTNVSVITSDSSVAQYARVSGCRNITSEAFLKEIKSSKRGNNEDEKINQMNNTEEFKKLFGV